MTLILGDVARRSMITPKLLDTDLKECVRQIDKDLQRLFIMLRPSLVVALDYSATVDTDVSIAFHFRITLTGDMQLNNPINGRDGQPITWEFIQDGVGSHSLTLDSKFKLGSSTPSVTLSTTAGARDMMAAIYNSVTDKYTVMAFQKGY